MQLSDVVRALRRGWLVIALTTAVVLAMALGATQLMPKKYEATTQLFVSTSGSGQDSQQLLQGSNFTQQRVKSYAEAIRTPYILSGVIQQLGLDTTPASLAQDIQTEVPLETVLIDVTVTEKDPEHAAAVANAVAQQFAAQVPKLESTSAGKSPVKITVMRQAVPPATPSSPIPLINGILGLLLGLLLGFAIALLRHYLDTSIRREEDVKDVTDEVILGGVPFFKEAKDQPLVVANDPHSPRAEAYRTLRTNLQFVQATSPTKSIVVTSSVPGEGKSTTTANLALTLVQGGSRVCLVEADLRRPRLLQYLGLAEGAGLTNLIVGDADLEDVLQPSSGGQLSVIGAGPIPPNPSELLGAPATARIIEHLTEEFDFVLFDAPPLLPVTDAAVLSRLTDGVLVVVGSEVVRKEQLQRTLGLLDTVNAHVLGLVVNRLAARGDDAAYSYYREGYEPDPVYDPKAPRTTKKGNRKKADRLKARTAR